MTIETKCRQIELFLSDVDGVLTDGRIVYDNQGIETKRFHVRDGIGIKLWQRSGNQFGILTQQIAYIGDDLPDLAVIRAVGLGVAVADAAVEVREAADFVTSLPGGSGAVREAIEMILKNQRRWEDAIRSYTG